MSHKLLLADDSVTIQKVIELTFADEDVSVTAVGNGQLAMDRIRAERPDIVLADVGMPERDGYEVAAFIKNTPEYAHIPVLLLTGAFEPVDEARAKAVRCDGVLAKPFEPQLLITKVKELLEGEVGEQTVRLTRAAVLPPAPAPAPVVDDDDTGPVPTLTIDPADLSLDTASLTESPAATPAADVSLDDYFDRLDAAFASLTGPGHGARETPEPEREDSWAPGPPPVSAGWQTEAVPVAAAVPAPSPAQPRAVPAAAPAPPAVDVPVADAFAALFGAEQQSTGAVPTGSPQTVTLPASVVTDDLVQAITRRVVEQLGTQELRTVVADVVSTVAERLVREEIERLKAKANG